VAPCVYLLMYKTMSLCFHTVYNNDSSKGSCNYLHVPIAPKAFFSTAANMYDEEHCRAGLTENLLEVEPSSLRFACSPPTRVMITEVNSVPRESN
jgi:hypothetical protein